MRDFVEVLKQVESLYPSSAGGTSKDEALRASLVLYTNSLFKEIEREQHWAIARTRTNIAVVAGTATYPIPAGVTAIQYVYYLDTSGAQVTIDLYEVSELRRVYGEGAVAAPGRPVKWAYIEPAAGVRQIQFFPVPDATYTMVVEGYSALTPIAETTGATSAASTVLTVNSTAYLTALGVPANGGAASVSVRAAGNLGVGGAADTHVTTWSAFPTANTVTMGAAAVTAVTPAQVFFNSQNWLITDFDKVVLFGLLRMVASYLRDDAGYASWEQRYQHEMDLMRNYEFDRSRSLELMAVGMQGQRQSELRRQDQLTGLDVRGV